MKLSPKAIRVIGLGVGQLDRRAKDAWARWIDRSPDRVITPDVASVVDSALVALERLIRDSAARETDDAKADLMNDAGFIHAIHSDLKKQMRETSRH